VHRFSSGKPVMASGSVGDYTYVVVPLARHPTFRLAAARER